MSLRILILAAGQGTRMRSHVPKVLHKLAGRSLLEHVYQTASALPHESISVVYGHGGNLVPDTLKQLQVHWVEQTRQLGTGHAVSQALPLVQDGDDVLILYGDVPLISVETLERLYSAASASGFAFLTAILDEPTGYGRIVRDRRGEVVRIVEQKDADKDERAIREINTGIMAVRGAWLKRWIEALDNKNKQGEYYLTDIVAMAAHESISIDCIHAHNLNEIIGINDRVQLAQVEAIYRRQQGARLMRDGVTLVDPERFDLRGSLEPGIDNHIDINVIIEGEVRFGNNISIGANCVLRDVTIADNAEIQPNCIVEQATIGHGCRIGPFARIRPETQLQDYIHIGNFVEVKKSTIDNNSRVNHLSYIGDAEIGRNVNVGAGTITCNYDGANKYKTIIEDNVFIGSDTQLIAPVRVASGATIGAGTTVTRNVDTNTLAVSRAEQRSVKNWKRPKKQEP